MLCRGNICLFLILLMLGAQLALAQHAGVHFTDRGHISNYEHDEQTPGVGELCQFCIFSKTLSHALTPDQFEINAGLAESSFKVPYAESHIARQASHGYLARGPPALLS